MPGEFVDINQDLSAELMEDTKKEESSKMLAIYKRELKSYLLP